MPFYTILRWFGLFSDIGIVSDVFPVDSPVLSARNKCNNSDNCGAICQYDGVTNSRLNMSRHKCHAYAPLSPSGRNTMFRIFRNDTEYRFKIDYLFPVIARCDPGIRYPVQCCKTYLIEIKHFGSRIPCLIFTDNHDVVNVIVNEYFLMEHAMLKEVYACEERQWQWKCGIWIVYITRPENSTIEIRLGQSTFICRLEYQAFPLEIPIHWECLTRIDMC